MNEYEVTLNRKKILIAEDEKNLLRSLEFSLKRHGYQVSTAPDTSTAILLFQNLHAGTCPFDLIIMDIQLSGKSGIDLIDTIRCSELTVPVLILTGYTDRDLFSRLEKKGASGFLVKPFSMDELMRRIEILLETTGAPVRE